MPREKENPSMSVENVRQFMRKAENTPTLQKQLKSIPQGGGQRTVAEIVKIAANAGFNFGAQDYEDAVNQVLAEKHAAGQLNEAELALITGGMMCVSSQGSWCLCCGPDQHPKPGTSHP
jgi:predicted ribosomally synthesized peptide with nif11-like leader